jgi:hypothetical protein
MLVLIIVIFACCVAGFTAAIDLLGLRCHQPQLCPGKLNV